MEMEVISARDQVETWRGWKQNNQKKNDGVMGFRGSDVPVRISGPGCRFVSVCA